MKSVYPFNRVLQETACLLCSVSSVLTADFSHCSYVTWDRICAKWDPHSSPGQYLWYQQLYMPWAAWRSCSSEHATSISSSFGALAPYNIKSESPVFTLSPSSPKPMPCPQCQLSSAHQPISKWPSLCFLLFHASCLGKDDLPVTPSYWPHCSSANLSLKFFPLLRHF